MTTISVTVPSLGREQLPDTGTISVRIDDVDDAHHAEIFMPEDVAVEHRAAHVVGETDTDANPFPGGNIEGVELRSWI